jgi:hypothetical protein
MEAFYLVLALNTIGCLIWGMFEIVDLRGSWIVPHFKDLCSLKLYVILCIELIFLRILL